MTNETTFAPSSPSHLAIPYVSPPHQTPDTSPADKALQARRTLLTKALNEITPWLIGNPIPTSPTFAQLLTEIRGTFPPRTTAPPPRTLSPYLSQKLPLNANQQTTPRSQKDRLQSESPQIFIFPSPQQTLQQLHRFTATFLTSSHHPSHKTSTPGPSSTTTPTHLHPLYSHCSVTNHCFLFLSRRLHPLIICSFRLSH